MVKSILFLILILVSQLLISELINKQLSENVSNESVGHLVPGLAECQIGDTKQWDADCVDSNQVIINDYFKKNPIKSNSNGNGIAARIFSIIFFSFLYFRWAKLIKKYRSLFFLLFLSINLILAFVFPWHLNAFEITSFTIAVVLCWLFNFNGRRNNSKR